MRQRILLSVALCAVSMMGTASAEDLRVLGAGSLREVMTEIGERYREGTGITVTADFGPSGLLRERIEKGEHVDPFASADMGHPLKLLRDGRAARVAMFTRNTLCGVAVPKVGLTAENFLDRLLDPAVRIGTSTPKADPAGDYTWLMFHVNSAWPNRLSLDEADDGVGNVRLLERSNLVGGKFHVHGCESVVEMLQLGGADDRSSDDRLGEQPRQRHLRPRNTPCRRDRRHAINDLSVRLGGVREKPRDRLVGFGADTRVVPVPRQLPTGLRAPRNDTDPFRRAKRQHLALFLPVEEVHQVLHADEAGPAMAFGNQKSSGELPRMHRRGPDVASLPGLDVVVKCFERLFDRCAVIPAVDLIEVDVIGAETPQAVIDLAHDRLARQATSVGSLAHASVDFGCDDNLVAAGEVPNRSPKDFLAAAKGIPVRRIKEVDAAFERPLDERTALRLVDAPGVGAAIGGARGYDTHAQSRHLQTGATELHIFHPSIS